MRILIVDDSRAMRMIVRRTLRQIGCDTSDTLEAASGREAMALATANTPDLILCDWNMPEMSGIELLRRLKDAGFRSTFGFVTSESTTDMMSIATAAGAAFFITKPFTEEEFRSALSGTLSL